MNTIILKILNVLPWIETSIFIVVLLLLAIHLWRKRQSDVQLSRIVILALCIQLLGLISYTFLNWAYFQNTPYATLLLPPHSSVLVINIARGISTILSGWIFTMVIFIGMWYIFLRRGKGTMLDTKDVGLFVISAIAVGWPAVLPFLGLTIAFSVFGLIFQILLRKKTLTDRLIITPYIMPAAILTLIVKAQLLALTHLDKIRF